MSRVKRALTASACTGAVERILWERASLDADRSIRRHALVGSAIIAGLVGTVGLWACMTQIAGAVIAAGSIVVETDVKKVQHPSGGVVGTVLVRNGDYVRAGDVVIRLDDTVAQANRAIVIKGLDEHYAREGRLEAERDGSEMIAFPDELISRNAVPAVARIMAGETQLLTFRRTSRAGQKAQLQERIAQLKQEVAGYDGQIAAKAREISLIEKELEGVRELWRKNLIQVSRLTALERDAARLNGEHGQFSATKAQANGKISETELQIIQLDRDFRSEVAKDLRDTEAKIAELVERRITAEDQLKRTDIRAPNDGIVHQLAVHTVGGVVAAGEPLLVVVPEADTLTVEAKVPPHEIDHVRRGQHAVLRYSAFNQRTTPELNGEVSFVSADVTLDPRQAAAAFYTIRISLLPGEVERLGTVRLVPGMPVDAFVQTGSRTALSYLTKPLVDQIARAWREK